jgi:hypothetical protein
MNCEPAKRISRGGQEGYALLLILFLLLALVLGTLALAPGVLTEGRRDKEEEMIWRGKQYVRGVKLYYQKTHRFPTNLEDLTKPKTGIRFMRQTYKDPMNSTDGSWRLIYVGPNGQLIGSLKNRAVGADGQPVSAFGSSAGSPNAFGSQSIFGQNSAFGSAGSSNVAQVPAAAIPLHPAPPATTADGGDTSTDAMSTPRPIDTSSSPNILGGNIIGVGSKIDQKSFKWYEKAKNYRQFEFIWDPSKDLVGPGMSGASQGIGTPIGNGPAGATPNSPFSTGSNPTQNPNPSPNPNPNPSPNPGQNPPPSPDPPLQAPPPNPN